MSIAVVVVVMVSGQRVVSFVGMRAGTVAAMLLVGLHAAGCLSGVWIRNKMRSTAMAAPKPLSIFTTVKPAAQLLSIPNKAVNPCKAEPYPMDVAPATRGAQITPPITLGKAPSIPATTMTAG